MHLTASTVEPLLNTGSEYTATNLDHNEAPLYFGIGPTAYMYRADALTLLSADEYNAATESTNPLFIHIDQATLFHLLRREYYFLSENN